MHKNEITFTINQQEKIQLFLPCELTDLFRYDDINATYFKNHEYKYTIYVNSTVDEFLDVIDTALKRTLSGDCKLDASLGKNIGYLWNEYLHYVENNADHEEIQSWIGKRYLLWSPRGIASWFYEKDGKFLLEVTPVYMWHFRDPEPEEKGEYVTYKQFMKSYKSYVVTELSRETICEWLEQTKYLLALIECNDDKYLVRDKDMIEKYKAFMDEKKDE